ncbi:Trp family transcriptional regulator [uncultured Psychrobacter sp.]|uniref:Trp family transcriptional regulator n=1 Tax=uncultured Psychrobacter sp. TaxID=259303 RepID=UPI002614FD2C|nr:Trp family transcriptional regulator [uncultured Psychrobacter sp.]
MSQKDIQANNQASGAYDYLLKLLVETDDTERLSAIFAALMTDKEQTELANRLTIFALLQQGMIQREISAKLGVGIATVSRGAKVFSQHQIDKLLPNIGEKIEI